MSFEFVNFNLKGKKSQTKYSLTICCTYFLSALPLSKDRDRSSEAKSASRTTQQIISMKLSIISKIVGCFHILEFEFGPKKLLLP